jgi:hypothetical protein
MTVMLRMRMSSLGLSSLSTGTSLICCTTSMPLVTRPNTVCFWSSHGCSQGIMVLVRQRLPPSAPMHITNACR